MIHDIGLFKSGPIDDAVSRFVGGRKDGWHGKERQARQEQNGSSSSSKDIRQRARVRACVRGSERGEESCLLYIRGIGRERKWDIPPVPSRRMTISEKEGTLA